MSLPGHHIFIFWPVENCTTWNLRYLMLRDAGWALRHWRTCFFFRSDSSNDLCFQVCFIRSTRGGAAPGAGGGGGRVGCFPHKTKYVLLKSFYNGKEINNEPEPGNLNSLVSPLILYWTCSAFESSWVYPAVRKLTLLDNRSLGSVFVFN